MVQKQKPRAAQTVSLIGTVQAGGNALIASVGRGITLIHSSINRFVRPFGTAVYARFLLHIEFESFHTRNADCFVLALKAIIFAGRTQVV